MTQEVGRIFNIQRFSVHDGPGIRDLVFLKGCPLRCRWCSNPESQNTDAELAFIVPKCIGRAKCGYCIGACPREAISANADDGIAIDRSKCNNCGKCVDVCFAKALTLFGNQMAVKDVMEVIQEQGGAWRASGGVTVSGGEPLLQAEFVAALLAACRARGIETAIETSGYAPWPDVEKVCQYCDWIFFDVKCMDANKHKRFTGVDNRMILANLQKLSARFPSTPLIVRTPIIPGFNDSEEDILAISGFLKQISSLREYELLAYHGFGGPKYKQLGREYLLDDVIAPDKAFVAGLNQKAHAVLAGK